MSEYIHEEFGRQSLDDQTFEPPFDDDIGSYEKPTWVKTCACGEEVERWHGESYPQCGECGATYNAFGQRLRDDWAGNQSNYDDNISDLDGYESQHAGD